MKLPKKLDILGITYTVEYATGDAMQNMAGWHIPKTSKIILNCDCNEDVQEETLLHEIIEAVTSKNNLPMEHQELATLSSCLYQVLKANLISFRRQDEKE